MELLDTMELAVIEDEEPYGVGPPIELLDIVELNTGLDELELENTELAITMYELELCGSATELLLLDAKLLEDVLTPQVP